MEDATTEKVTVTEEELVEEDMVVAVVNDVEITGKTYNTVYTQTKELLNEQGQDVDDQELVKEKALTALVSQEVLAQDTAEKGIEVEEEEIDTYIEDAKEQFDSEKAFEKELAKMNYTSATFRDQVTSQLRQQKYLEQEFGDIEVSEDDIQAYYDSVAEQNDDIPNFNDVRDNIEAQLANTQLRDKLNDRIEQLKDDADIETMI